MAQEKLLENKIKAWLQTQGIYAVGTPKQKMTVKPCGYYEKRWGSKMTVSGLPDMHISVCGQDLEIELKAPKGRPSELQKHMIKQMQDTGAHAFILYEDKKDNYLSLDELKTLILEIKRKWNAKN